MGQCRSALAQYPIESKPLWDNQVWEFDAEIVFPQIPHVIFTDFAIEVLVDGVVEGALDSVIGPGHQFGVDRRSSFSEASIGVLTGEESAQVRVVKIGQ